MTNHRNNQSEIEALMKECTLKPICIQCKEMNCSGEGKYYDDDKRRFVKCDKYVPFYGGVK